MLRSDNDHMPASELIVTRPVDGTMVVTIDRAAKRNALDANLVECLHEALDAAAIANAHLLCLRGAGVSFCTGFDLSDLDSETDGDLLLRFVRIEMLLNRIYNAPFVTLALAHGDVRGAGADLFAACERRFVVDDARFCFPGAALGAVAGIGRLVSRVGRDHGREIMRSGRELGADEALAIGLASGLVTRADVDSLLTRESAAASRLDRETIAALHAVRARDGAEDLAHLTMSAARPGLKDRILAYRERMTQRKQQLALVQQRFVQSPSVGGGDGH